MLKAILFSFLLTISPSLCAEYRIHNATEFIDFSESVNNGENFTGTTVLLDSDIDLLDDPSQSFEPIGDFDNKGKLFFGVFDGQGHTISNLRVNSTIRYVGLFGCSSNITIRNVVIDDSCSFVSTAQATTHQVTVAGVLGKSSAEKGPITIENAVNMASVTFEGNSNRIAFIGGIVGSTYAPDFDITVKNCVNYGTITHSGVCGDFTEIGGIAGIGEGTSKKKIYIQNCANHGQIVHSGVSTSPAAGGIVGVSFFTVLENCVSSGEISTNKEGEYIGKVIGEIQKYTEITHCFWTNDGSNLNAYGHNSTYVNVTDSSLVTLSQATVDELNRYASKDTTFDRWFMLHPNGGKIGNAVKETLIVTQKRFPDPVKEDNLFIYWCKDVECVGKYNPETDSISEIRELYAGWATNNVLRFDFGNGTVVEDVVLFNTTIVYPSVADREGFRFNGWDSAITLMPPWDVTITAKWTKLATSKSVEIVFDTKDVTMKEEEIKNIISGITNDNFVIERIETDPNTGETKVIIRFSDEEKATEFIEAASEDKGSSNFIKFVRQTDGFNGFSSRSFALPYFLLIALGMLFNSL